MLSYFVNHFPLLLLAVTFNSTSKQPMHIAIEASSLRVMSVPYVHISCPRIILFLNWCHKSCHVQRILHTT